MKRVSETALDMDNAEKIMPQGSGDRNNMGLVSFEHPARPTKNADILGRFSETTLQFPHGSPSVHCCSLQPMPFSGALLSCPPPVCCYTAFWTLMPYKWGSSTTTTWTASSYRTYLLSFLEKHSVPQKVLRILMFVFSSSGPEFISALVMYER